MEQESRTHREQEMLDARGNKRQLCSTVVEVNLGTNVETENGFG